LAHLNPELRSRWHAFTLVELLVTITIIGMLVGMLLPALGAARESARRSQCVNNMSQIGKAIITFDAEHLKIPGWRDRVDLYTKVMAGDGSTKADACVSWTVPILPFIDQKEIYDWYETYQGASGVDDVKLKRIATFVCPTVVTDLASKSPLCYAVNAGTGCETLIGSGSSTPKTQPRADGLFLDAAGNSSEGNVADPWYDQGRPNYKAAKSNLSQVASADGSTNTLMIAEKCGLTAPNTISWAANPLAAQTNSNAVVSAHVFLHPHSLDPANSQNVRVINPTAQTRPPVDPVPTGADPDDWSLRYPSSRHRGGVVSVFADGHARFLSEKISPWVYCQMLTSNSKVIEVNGRAWSCQRYIKAPGESPVSYIFDDEDLDK